MTELYEWFNGLLMESEITPQSTALRLVMAVVLGLCIGGERQARRRDAGMRTFTLICLGSAGAVVISIWIPQIYPELLNGDPGRIAAQVLTGVGFLGAGAIMRSKGSIMGLTTAACIWQTSIVGMAAGAGLYAGAVILTALTLFVLVTMERIERLLRIAGDNQVLTIKMSTISPDVDSLRKAVSSTGAKLKEGSMDIDRQKNISTITYRITTSKDSSQSEIILALSTIPDIMHVSIDL